MAGKPQIDVTPGLGERLEQLRRRAEQSSSSPISWSSVARSAGISRQTLYRALKRGHLTRGVAQRLAEVLGSSEHELLFGADVRDLERMIRELPEPPSGLAASAFYVRKVIGGESVALTTPEDVAHFLQRSDALELLARWAQARRKAQPSPNPASAPARASEFAQYAGDLAAIQATLEMLPRDASGQRLKLALLNNLEDLCRETGSELSADYWDVRRRVHAGEL